MSYSFYTDVTVDEIKSPLNLKKQPAPITDDWGTEDDKPQTLGQIPNKIAAMMRQARKEKEDLNNHVAI